MNNIAADRILIVDDHQMFTDGLKSILGLDEKIKDVQSAGSAEEALQKLARETFDLIISDIGLPGMNGITLTQKIKQKNAEQSVLILSMHMGRELVKEILSVEADGYLLKKANKQELFSAIGKVLDGGTYYCSEVTSIMMELVNQKQKSKLTPSCELTLRELEILQLICREYSSKEIADKLCIGTCTVETHRRSMFQKTSVKSVVGLIRYAVENNLTMWP